MVKISGRYRGISRIAPEIYRHPHEDEEDKCPDCGQTDWCYTCATQGGWTPQWRADEANEPSIRDTIDSVVMHGGKPHAT